ncbi:MAG TPA: hypothetical protein VGG69_07290 [Rhizomicrobium sp.]
MGIRQVGFSPLRSGGQIGCLGFQCLSRSLRIGIKRAFAREILFGLRKPLPQALSFFARAVLLGIQRFTFEDETVQSGPTLCLCLTEGR